MLRTYIALLLSDPNSDVKFLIFAASHYSVLNIFCRHSGLIICHLW